MYRLSCFLLTGILFLSVHSTSLARDQALHTTEIANLSEIWAAGRYLNPDLATAPKEWDSLYSELAAKLAKGQISLADAQDKLAELSGAYQIKPRYFSKIDVVKTIQSDAQNSITKLPGYLILRLRNKLCSGQLILARSL